VRETFAQAKPHGSPRKCGLRHFLSRLRMIAAWRGVNVARK
jgi:hypothetical protein